jgi:hypothetical protein
MESSYQSIYEKYCSKSNYFNQYGSSYSADNLALNIGFYNEIIEIRVVQKNTFILTLSISENSFGMWEPKPRLTRGKEKCLEIIREEYPAVFEGCLWNL